MAPQERRRVSAHFAPQSCRRFPAAFGIQISSAPRPVPVRGSSDHAKTAAILGNLPCGAASFLAMSTFLSDVTYAFRTLRSNAGFTAVAVAALALGIGANTAIFTVVDGVMLAPLPYPQADRLVRLGRKYPSGNGYSNSIPKYMVWRNNNVFAAMTLYEQGGIGMNLGARDHPEQAKVSHVSKDYFQVFGSLPAIGRTFSEAEDVPHGAPAAVLSDRLWRNRRGHPQIVGRNILLNNQPYAVVGIMPKGFESNPPMDVWLPLQADPCQHQSGPLPGRGRSFEAGRFHRAGARRHESAGRAIPCREFQVDGPQRERSRSPHERLDGGECPARAFDPAGRRRIRAADCLRQCCQPAAGAGGRSPKELAIRAAIGASRWRVVRQLLTESVILAGAGAVLGFAIGAAGVRALLMVAPGTFRGSPRRMDSIRPCPCWIWRVAGFTIGIAALTAILFGLFPRFFLQSRPRLDFERRRADRRGHDGPAFTRRSGGHRSGAGAGAGDRRDVAHPHLQRTAVGESRV